MMRFIFKLARAEKGATAIEYGLILALLMVAIMSGVSVLGSSTRGAWGNMANKVSAVEPS